MAIDTDRWFVVCANVLGGCQGSTGPASPHPIDGKPYGSRFPVVTIRDMVRAQVRLADHLSIPAWHSVVGGSMGGMQVLEWAITFPDRVRSIVPIATCAQATAQQIAWGAIGRRAIRIDPNWRGGDYYDADENDGPWEGLSVARMVRAGHIPQRQRVHDRFGRELADGATLRDSLDLWQRFEVERYLDHHGEKLVRRFDANSYLIIGKAMDLHDVARGRGGLEAAMARIKVPTLTVGISSDILYPSYQQRQIRDCCCRTGRRASTSRSIHRTARRIPDQPRPVVGASSASSSTPSPRASDSTRFVGDHLVEDGHGAALRRHLDGHAVERALRIDGAEQIDRLARRRARCLALQRPVRQVAPQATLHVDL
jgi:homoserine O-acetyltransferase